MPTALLQNIYRAQLVACDALLLEMPCYSSKSSFLLFTSSPSFLFALPLCLSYFMKNFVTFGGANRGTAECVKKCGRFHTSNRATMCVKRIVFSAASCQYGLV